MVNRRAKLRARQSGVTFPVGTRDFLLPCDVKMGSGALLAS